METIKRQTWAAYSCLVEGQSPWRGENRAIGQSHKEEEREGGSGTGEGGLYLDICIGVPEFVETPLLMACLEASDAAAAVAICGTIYILCLYLLPLLLTLPNGGIEKQKKFTGNVFNAETKNWNTRWTTAISAMPHPEQFFLY